MPVRIDEDVELAGSCFIQWNPVGATRSTGNAPEVIWPVVRGHSCTE